MPNYLPNKPKNKQNPIKSTVIIIAQRCRFDNQPFTKIKNVSIYQIHFGSTGTFGKSNNLP